MLFGALFHAALFLFAHLLKPKLLLCFANNCGIWWQGGDVAVCIIVAWRHLLPLFKCSAAFSNVSIFREILIVSHYLRRRQRVQQACISFLKHKSARCVLTVHQESKVDRNLERFA